MPVQATKGAASAQGFGQISGGSGEKVYIEDVFSTYLYKGTGATQTITNGIDLSTKGGLAWLKIRTGGTYTHYLFDTSRGPLNYLSTTTNSGQFSLSGSLTAFNTNGFSLGGTQQGINGEFLDFVSWTFRKQPKFFDVVTYTGTGSTQNINHNLGSVPGCIIVKRLEPAVGSDWCVYHRANTASPATQILFLNDASGTSTSSTYWGNTLPTSTGFTVNDNIRVNASGGTYVAYLFAHNAGGFGLSGTDNVISCGSFTTDGSGNATVNLGYEPQWILTKTSSVVNDWELQDSMRGLSYSNNGHLQPNTSAVENPNYVGYTATATGFNAVSRVTSTTYIYIAIRRGPMKVPTSGTSVYKSNTRTGNGTEPTITGVGFVPDLIIPKHRQTGSFGNSTGHLFADRLRGNNNWLFAPFTDGETGSGGNMFSSASQTYNIGWSRMYESGIGYVDHVFRRAPGFFDVVCYTGTGAASQSYNHNLGVAPELMLVKVRSASGSWAVYSSALGASTVLTLNATDAAFTSGSVFSAYWGSAAPTSSVFSVGSIGNTGGNGSTYVAYLFATCAGVSKVGGYTGTGTTQQINCGFTGGARFVLIKRTDSTGDWYVWDSARGIVAGNDPYLLLNSTAAEVTSTDYIDTYSAGFEISSTAPAAINANGGTYIYLAIA